jgi:hypothetical protein
MNPRKKRVVFWLMILVLLIPVTFLTRSILRPPSAPIHTIRVMESVRSPYFLPQYLALNLGFFKEQNLVVEISTASPEAIRAALLDGRADIALCGLQKIIFSPNTQTPQPKIFAAIAKKDGSLLLSREDPVEFQWKNLKNKTIISGSQDDSSVIALEEVLRSHGLPPFRAVTIYYNIPAKLRMGAFRAPVQGIICKCWNRMPALPKEKATARWQLQWGRRQETWRLQLMRPCLIILIQNLRLFNSSPMLFTRHYCGWTSTVPGRQRMQSCRPSPILTGRSL